jgi:hypothetical protein
MNSFESRIFFHQIIFLDQEFRQGRMEVVAGQRIGEGFADLVGKIGLRDAAGQGIVGTDAADSHIGVAIDDGGDDEGFPLSE